MIYQATRRIADEFTSRKLKFEVKETNSGSLVTLSCKGDNIKDLTVLFISRDDDPDVSIRAYELASFPADKRQKGIDLANELNQKFRYLKFVLDDDGDLDAQYDLPVKCDISQVGELAMEMLSRYLNIVDEAYPQIMQAVWG